MTPQEKAKDLVKWAVIYGASKDVSKLFAIKIADEIITMVGRYSNYWQEVKHEIEKL